LGSMTETEMRGMARGTQQHRRSNFKPLSSITPEECLQSAPLSWSQHILVPIFLAFAPPNGVFSVPVTTFIVGYFIVGNVYQTALFVAFFILLPLALLPQPFVPSVLHSWMAWSVLKYFSMKLVIEDMDQSWMMEKNTPSQRIMVAPPHGVFPYGNMLAIIAWPQAFGYAFRGLASSAALRPPIFKQVFRSMGVVDASRKVARATLENGESIGISTGGVAEVFETNADDECILLKERIGVIKLAIRTGSDLVPCYLFGNTKLLNGWCGEGLPGQSRHWLQMLSRKLGFAIIFVYGRFGLPVPFRKPILAVVAKPIPTKHVQCEDPPMELVLKIQKELLGEMERVFESYKKHYGWEDKKLIIK